MNNTWNGLTYYLATRHKYYFRFSGGLDSLGGIGALWAGALGRRNSLWDNSPPPPARRGQGVPNSLQTLTNSFDFANSKSSSGSTGVPPTLAPEILFSHLRLLFSFLFFKLAAQKFIKNQTSINSSQNLKNWSPGCPKLDFGTILDDLWHPFFDKFS